MDALPLIFVFAAAWGFVFIPVTVMKAVWLRNSFALTWRRAIGVAVITGITSVGLVVPALWIFLAVVQILDPLNGYANGGGLLSDFLRVTLNAPLMLGDPAPDWVYYLSSLYLSVCFFVASWFVEFQMLIPCLKEIEMKSLSGYSRNVNAIAYLLILAVLCIPAT